MYTKYNDISGLGLHIPALIWPNVVQFVGIKLLPKISDKKILQNVHILLKHSYIEVTTSSSISNNSPNEKTNQCFEDWVMRNQGKPRLV